MKVNSLKYVTRESFKNISKQKMMAVATVSIIAACFIVFGIFALIMLNVNSLADAEAQKPEVMVYCLSTLTDQEVNSVEAALKADPDVKATVKITKEQAAEKVKKDLFSGNEDLLKGLGSMDFLPVSFSVKLVDPTKSSVVIPKLEAIQGVETVKSPVELVNKILQARTAIQLVSWVLFGILIGVSVLIISNAIKLTVHARRREIGIMKYVGATDRFIRGPFIIEGIILGSIGSAAAFCIISYLYSTFINNNQNQQLQSAYNIKLIDLANLVSVPWLNLTDGHGIYLGVLLFLMFISLGILMGVTGSLISMRKYLKV